MTKGKIRIELEDIVNPIDGDNQVSDGFLDDLFNFFSSSELEGFLDHVKKEREFDIKNNEDDYLDDDLNINIMDESEEDKAGYYLSDRDI